MTASSAVQRSCPKCGSIRVHRSRRRGITENTLAITGADICRCHDCRARQAWFGSLPIPLSSAAADEPRLGMLLYASGVVACIWFVWWMVTRYTGISG